jgi:hypothetical protein
MKYGLDLLKTHPQPLSFKKRGVRRYSPSLAKGRAAQTDQIRQDRRMMVLSAT